MQFLAHSNNNDFLHYGDMMGGSSWGMMGGNWVFMFLFWVLALVGVVVLIKWVVDQNKNNKKDSSTLDILKQRYAKGEIDKKELEERKKDLV